MFGRISRAPSSQGCACSRVVDANKECFACKKRIQAELIASSIVGALDPQTQASKQLTLARAVAVQVSIADRLRVYLKLSALILARTDLTHWRSLPGRGIVHHRLRVRVRSSTTLTTTIAV